MTKILLVEDDKSLREIYGVRLLAEGYDIVSAGDGEEALAMAIKDRPALIVSDVMMPKISGFDMLDILRSTTETKDIKVIMMTALSSEDQRKRGEQLGADRYLVKSQVGIEDVVRTVHDVLADAPTSAAAFPPSNSPPPDAPQPTPVATTTEEPTQAPAQDRSTPLSPSPRPDAASTPTPVNPVVSTPAPAASAVPPPLPQPTAPFSTPRPGNLASRVIEPISDSSPSPAAPVADLMDKELAAQPPVQSIPVTSPDPEPQAAAPAVDVATPPPPATAPVEPPPAPETGLPSDTPGQYEETPRPSAPVSESEAPTQSQPPVAS